MAGRGPTTPRSEAPLTGGRASAFFNIEPETSGSMVKGSRSGALTVVFDTWLGDDLIRPYPAVLVTTPVKRALAALRHPIGFVIARARIRASPFFRKHSPGKRLPVFWAVHVSGKTGRDDMGLTEAGVLVVSRRVMDVLLGFRIGRSILTQYLPTEARAADGEMRGTGPDGVRRGPRSG